MPYVVPYAPSQIYQQNGRLVDLIRAKGEQDADAQRRAGEIQARMWGNIGQSINDSVGNILQAKRQAPIDALNQLKVDEAKQLAQGKAVVDAGLKGAVPVGPQPEGEAPAQAQHPYLDSDGLADPKKIGELLAANGMGHLAPELLKGVEAQNSSILAYKQHQQEAGTKQTIMLGSVANTTLALMNAGVPFEQAAGHASSSLIATGATDAPTVQKMIAQLSQLPPDQLTAQLTQMKAQAARLGPTKTLADGAKEVDMFGGTIAENQKNEPGKGDYTINGQRFKADGTPIGATVPTQTLPKDWQKSSVLLDGKPAEILTDPSPSGKIYDLNHKEIENAAARVKPIPPASLTANPSATLSGDALDMAAKRYLATGELPSMGMGAAGAAARVAVMNAAAKIDPAASLALNKATYKSDSANLANLQKTEGTLSAFERTAGKNLDQFLALADKVPDTGVPWLNTPLRSVNAQGLGNADQAAFNAARDVALREIARVTNDPKLSGVLSDSARKEVSGLAAGNATFAQIKAVAKVLKQDMNNVHTSLTQQIEQVKGVLGQNPDASAATGGAKRVYYDDQGRPK